MPRRTPREGGTAPITTHTDRRRPQLATAAGILIATGALFLVTKGVVRAATGADPSLVPFFSAFAGVGLVAAAAALWRATRRHRWLCATAAALAAGGTAAAIVATAYLVTGTIPETAGASPVVGGSYAMMSIGVFGSLVALGVAVAGERVPAASAEGVNPQAVVGGVDAVGQPPAGQRDVGPLGRGRR